MRVRQFWEVVAQKIVHGGRVVCLARGEARSFVGVEAVDARDADDIASSEGEVGLCADQIAVDASRPHEKWCAATAIRCDEVGIVG